MDSSRQAEGREWSGGDGSGVEGRGGKGRAGQGRVPDCLGGLSRVGISSRSTRPWNGQPPSLVLFSRTSLPIQTFSCNTTHLLFALVMRFLHVQMHTMHLLLTFSVILHQHSQSKQCVCGAVSWHETVLLFAERQLSS